MFVYAFEFLYVIIHVHVQCLLYLLLVISTDGGCVVYYILLGPARRFLHDDAG